MKLNQKEPYARQGTVVLYIHPYHTACANSPKHRARNVTHAIGGYVIIIIIMLTPFQPQCSLHKQGLDYQMLSYAYRGPLGYFPLSCP